MKDMIPKNLVEAIQILLKFENTGKFKNSDPGLYHYSTGRMIRNNWGLWNTKSDLHKFFNLISIYHADDMSGIIFDTLHRILNKKKIDLKGQVERYEKYWKGLDCDMKGNLL